MSILSRNDENLSLETHTDKKQDGLKPCPFCGNKSPKLRETLDFYFFYSVVCEKCRTESGKYSAPEKAIGAWNKRENT